MSAAELGRQAPGHVVLIAEDEPDNQLILRTVVESLVGARAVVVADGLEALAAVDRARPSIILLDLMMPVLDGFQVARQLKANPATADIPVIAISALVRPDDRAQALAVGCDEFIRKPFDLDALERVVRDCLARASAPPG